MSSAEALASLDERIGLLQAALEQSGSIVRNQLVLISELQGELRLRNNQLADWQQRCRSLEERLMDNFPPPPDAAEMDRLRQWVVELELRLDAEHTLNLALQSQVRAWRDKYRNSASAADSRPLVTDPTSTAEDSVLG